MDIPPRNPIPKNKSAVIYCVYKERVLLDERINLTISRDKNSSNKIEVVDITYSGSPIDGLETPNSSDLVRHCEMYVNSIQFHFIIDLWQISINPKINSEITAFSVVPLRQL